MLFLSFAGLPPAAEPGIVIAMRAKIVGAIAEAHRDRGFGIYPPIEDGRSRKLALRFAKGLRSRDDYRHIAV